MGGRAAGRRPRAGGGTAPISTSKSMLRCLFRRCFFLVRAPVACRRPPPRRLRTAIVPVFYAPGRQDRRAARKLGDLARGCAVILRSGGAKTARRPRNGRPGPPADRYNTDEPKHETAIPRYCQPFLRPGTSNPRECRRFRKLHLRICRKSPARPRAGTSNPSECCEFAERPLRIRLKLPPRPPSVTSIPRQCCAFRKRTPPLARERSQGRSESTVFCRADGGQAAQIAGPSALDGRILDSVAIFGGAQQGPLF